MKVPAFFLLLLSVLLSCNTKKGKEATRNDSIPGKKPDSSQLPNPGTGATSFIQVDISPMDMCYFPVDFPQLKMTKVITSPPLARVIYSRPHLQGRHIFHEVLKYGEPWRLGANESTELDLYADATIINKKISAGRYVLYCIPTENKWTIVLNSNIDSWGLQPDPSRDVERFVIPVTHTGNSLEYYTMLFEKSAGGANLLMAWDNVEARLPIVF